MPNLPSAQLDHCSFVVPHLDNAVDFFCTWLGFDIVAQKGPVQSADTDHITQTYAMPRNAVGRWKILQKGASRIGLVEWQVYGSSLNPLRESSVPGCCIALQVDDLVSAVDQLKTIPRMNFLEMNQEGFVYCITPFGFQLQLIQQGVSLS